MRILFVGDVVGRSGRAVVNETLPGLIRDWKLDLTVVNGENAAGGFGITEAIYHELLEAGADAITLGNHSWDQREALVLVTAGGLSYEEAAEVCGCAVGTIKSRVNRARKALLEIVDKGEAPARDGAADEALSTLIDDARRLAARA